MTDDTHLTRLPLAVVEGAMQFIGRSAPNAIAGAPEIRRARLIRDVAQHAADFPLVDFAKRLAAELEVVALLIDRPAPVAVDENSLFNAGNELVERYILRSRLQRDVRHPGEWNAGPRIPIGATVRSLAADERRKLAARLPVDENPVFH